MSENNILIFWEDDPDLVTMFSIFLQEHGYRVTGVESLDECIKECESKTPIVLIIQCFMEGSTAGLEYIRKIRTHPNIPYFPIIVGWADFPNIDDKHGYSEAFEAGANACFGRVFDITDVLKQVKLLHNDPALTGLIDKQTEEIWKMNKRK